MPARAWGFKSPLRHHIATLKAHFAQEHVEPWSAGDLDLQEVGGRSQRSRKYLDQDPLLSVSGLLPDALNIERAEDRGHLLDASASSSPFEALGE